MLLFSFCQAVRDLLLGSTGDEHKKSEHHFLITTRAEDRGYRYCSSFAQYVEDVSSPNHENAPHKDTSQKLQGCFGMSSTEFSSKILQFVEMKPCGERALSFLTLSSANGLAKWTGRLLTIGRALPLVSDDASAAVMTLVDLYILTVFRFCAGSKLNEDVLIGLGRGTTTRAASSTSISLSMEADTVAPLPRDGNGFAKTQEFFRSSRKRLESMVNLDKFQSIGDDDMCPQSTNAAVNFAKRLEKETSAACSCFFAAVLVDVASQIFNNGQDHGTQKPLWAELKDMEASIEKDEDISDLEMDESFDAYAKAAVSIVPNLITQTTRLAAVKAICGKEVIFQIVCCGRIWEGDSMQEQSNEYVDDLCERCAFLWGHLSSSMRLPPPALQYTWDQLVRSAFMLLLEGFSKVGKCSTEGRSLMSMDLATLSHGLIPRSVQEEVEDEYPMISPPPPACREEMMRYVDTFIKVFYFPNEDIINWIKENAGDYHLDHSLSLVTSKAAGSKDKAFQTDGKKSVIDIYNQIK